MIDQISALRIMIEKVRENCHLYIAFIDLKATFSSLDQTALWHILRSTGMPIRVSTLLSRLYDSPESSIVASSRLSAWFPVMMGVRQGCVAAPDLLNCAIDFLISHMCEKV